MSTLVIEHVDETGAPCAHHAPVAADALLQLAMVGSRASAFHHDCASKLQGLVMALDELSELTENADPQLLRALEAALDSTRELNALLATNRALTKLAARTQTGIAELMRRAAQRVGVTLQGIQDVASDVVVDIAAPAMTHALALAIDVAAGAGRSRTIALAAQVEGEAVELALQASPTPPGNASEALAIASFVLARDGGKLWCSAAGDRVWLRLPLSRA